MPEQYGFLVPGYPSWPYTTPDGRQVQCSHVLDAWRGSWPAGTWSYGAVQALTK